MHDGVYGNKAAGQGPPGAKSEVLGVAPPPQAAASQAIRIPQQHVHHQQPAWCQQTLTINGSLASNLLVLGHHSVTQGRSGVHHSWSVHSEALCTHLQAILLWVHRATFSTGNGAAWREDWPGQVCSSTVSIVFQKRFLCVHECRPRHVVHDKAAACTSKRLLQSTATLTQARGCSPGRLPLFRSRPLQQPCLTSS